MKHLKRSLTLPFAEASSVAVIILLIVAMLGFADATYLTIEHYRGVIPPCSIIKGCEIVLTSPYSVLFGVPVSLLGALYYLLVSLGAFIYLESKHGKGEIATHHSSILKWTLIITVFGFGMSLWFVYIQLFVLHSICTYCIGSALTSTILFITAIVMLRHSSIKQTEHMIVLRRL